MTNFDKGTGDLIVVNITNLGLDDLVHLFNVTKFPTHYWDREDSMILLSREDMSVFTPDKDKTDEDMLAELAPLNPRFVNLLNDVWQETVKFQPMLGELLHRLTDLQCTKH